MMIWSMYLFTQIFEDKQYLIPPHIFKEDGPSVIIDFQGALPQGQGANTSLLWMY